MTRELKHLLALNVAFEFPNEALSSCVQFVRVYISMCVCVCFSFFLNHHIALFLCKYNIYPHAQQPEMSTAYEVLMATARCTNT